mmetsp:Transcript_28151/g.72991  ORF Transcript_28151/g.72991 Transcript_28151/m.72991 type:complete len:317 (+) Transcript_28151:1309-2259(+)
MLRHGLGKVKVVHVIRRLQHNGNHRQGAAIARLARWCHDIERKAAVHVLNATGKGKRAVQRLAQKLLHFVNPHRCGDGIELEEADLLHHWIVGLGHIGAKDTPRLVCHQHLATVRCVTQLACHSPAGARKDAMLGQRVQPMIDCAFLCPVDAHPHSWALVEQLAIRTDHLLAAWQPQHLARPWNLQELILHVHAELDSLEHILERNLERIAFRVDLVSRVPRYTLPHNLVVDVLNLLKAFHTGSSHFRRVKEVRGHKCQLPALPDLVACQGIITICLLKRGHQSFHHGLMLPCTPLHLFAEHYSFVHEVTCSCNGR